MNSTTTQPNWEERYQSVGADYLFGTQPNEFLASCQPLFNAGETAICVADGEGRNSVWLAKQGLDVTAVEYSPTALAKAEHLAAQHGVKVSYVKADILAADWPSSPTAQYDWVIAVFIQFADARQRAKQFNDLKALCKSGGRILLVGYTLKQLEYGTGGPSNPDNLYSEELLQQAFADYQIETLRSYEKVLDEGSRHRGQSAVVGMIAAKP
ncbi:methyltransferase domain-containing protein [Paludibacterium sp. dN 18-1]|uniref:Methyltransferase domain-containing protein n=2 Tax=Paludibacterium denitrificans TaxID=2675226 RepID=A0A844G7P4_9NEIS|nr:methyltransferase domain-containing protein [Paludibacterium denitrificans]